MMASQSSKVHDPMYNFDTHFPDRLSRIHLHSDSPASFRKRKSRAQRCGSRYKTQPVTFDEITEVDEEPNNEDKPQGEKLKGQLQAFSRSMDGLLPRSGGHEHSPHHISHSRSGSRKFHRHPDCIPERVEAESATSPQPQTSHQQQLLFGGGEIGGSVEEGGRSYQLDKRVPDNSGSALADPTFKSTSSDSAIGASICESQVRTQRSGGSELSSSSTPLSSSSVPQAAEARPAPSNMAPRRQKVTAKAKKRQKASEEGQVS